MGKLCRTSKMAAVFELTDDVAVGQNDANEAVLDEVHFTAFPSCKTPLNVCAWDILAE